MYATGTFDTSECNANDTIQNFDADTYGIQPYAGFNPTTAPASELACYGLDQDPNLQAGMTYDGSDAPTLGGGGSEVTDGAPLTAPSGYDTSSEGSGSPSNVHAAFLNIWAGYMNQGTNGTNPALETGESYTRSFARWIAHGSSDATLTWVGMGGYGTEYQPDTNTPCAGGSDSKNVFGTPNTECIIQAGTISGAPGQSSAVQFWYENYPYEQFHLLTHPVVHVGDSVDVFVHYAPGTRTASYTFHNITTNTWRIIVERIHDPTTASAECVVEQGFYRPYTTYTTSTTGTNDSIPFQGCGVRWINDPQNDNSPHGIVRIGSSADPGPITDLYGYVGWPHHTLDSNGDFTLSCHDRYPYTQAGALPNLTEPGYPCKD